jgi:hypothetical protein
MGSSVQLPSYYLTKTTLVDGGYLKADSPLTYLLSSTVTGLCVVRLSALLFPFARKLRVSNGFSSNACILKRMYSVWSCNRPTPLSLECTTVRALHSIAVASAQPKPLYLPLLSSITFPSFSSSPHPPFLYPFSSASPPRTNQASPFRPDPRALLQKPHRLHHENCSYRGLPRPLQRYVFRFIPFLHRL